MGVRDELRGNGQVFTVEGEERVCVGGGEACRAKRRWLMERRKGRDMEEEERGTIYSAAVAAARRSVIALFQLTSNRPSHLSVPRAGPVMLTRGCLSEGRRNNIIIKQRRGEPELLQV